MDEVDKQRNIHKATRLALNNGNVKISKLLIPLCDITGLFWGKNYLLTVLKKNQIDIFLQLIEKMNEKELKRFCPPPMIKIFLELLGEMNKEDVKKIGSLKSIIFAAIKSKQYKIVRKLNQIYGQDIFAVLAENEVEVFVQLLGKINQTEAKKLCQPKMVIHAMNRKKLKTAAQLMKICDYDDFDFLKRAILTHETKTALMLIENGYAFTNGKESALILAIRKKNTEVAKELINKNCNLNFIDSSGNCALVKALGNYTIFSSLIENDIDLEGVNCLNEAFWWGIEIQVVSCHNPKALEIVNELYRLGCKNLFTKAPLRIISAVKLYAKMRTRKVCEVLVSENPVHEDFPKELASFLFREDILKEIFCLQNSSNKKRKLDCDDQERKKKRRKL